MNKRVLHTTYLLILSIALFWAPVVTRAADTRELSLTTAFLFNFAKYTEWPDSEALVEDPFVFCVEKDAEVISFMDKLTSRTLRKRQLEIAEVSSTVEVSKCDVIYFEGQTDLFQSLDLKRLSVLVVGRDIEEADITLFKAEDTLQFKIRLDRAEAQGFKFRSQLLKIAVETR